MNHNQKAKRILQEIRRKMLLRGLSREEVDNQDWGSYRHEVEKKLKLV